MGITHPLKSLPPSHQGLNSVPGAALVRRAVTIAARPNKLPVLIAVAIVGHAHALAADSHNRLRRADQHRTDAVGSDAVGKGHLGAVNGAEIALRVGIVVGSLDDVDCEVAVCRRVSVSGEGNACGRGGRTGKALDAVGGEGHVILCRAGAELEVHGLDITLLERGDD